MVVSRELNDDLDSVGSLVVPPASGPDTDTAESYNMERSRVEDMDVIAGLRELDTGQGIRWRVERVNADDPSLNGFLKEIETEALTLEGLTNKFGPGTYKITGRYPGGQYAASRRVKIAGDAPRLIKGDTAAPAVMQMDEWERRQEIRDERRRKERNELLALLIPAVAPIAAALISNRGPDMAALVTALKPPPPPDPLQQMAALKELMSGTQKESPLDAAVKLLEIIQDKAPPGGETGWTDVVKELAKNPAIAGMLGGLLTRGSPVPNSAPLSGSSVPPPLPELAPPADAVPVSVSAENAHMFGMLKLLPWLRAQLAMALEKAADDRDPGLIAERIIDDLPKGADPRELIQFVARADWLQQLATFEPRVQQYAEWFGQMREAMLEQFNIKPAESMSVNVQPPAPPGEPERPKPLPPLGSGS